VIVASPGVESKADGKKVDSIRLADSNLCGGLVDPAWGRPATARSGAIASLGGLCRGWRGALAFAAAAASSCGGPLAFGADATTAQVETVRFSGPRWPAVRVVRGLGTVLPQAEPVAVPSALSGPVPHPDAVKAEIVTFGDGHGASVQVLRGPSTAPPPAPDRVETVRFPGRDAPSVNVVRGPSTAGQAVELFSAADGGELDRVAFAIDGVESGHGRTPLMWRPDLDGPQGPMQVSAAAALDVGGGDRFDIRQNRLIGRAFLAQMYERYGNWPDAIAAYNWGPGHVDRWITLGRPVEQLPLETARYLLKVLHDSFLISAPRR
jgi:hypothetical protein